MECCVGSTEVRDGLIDVFGAIPANMRRTLTWDQGSEMHQWRKVEDTLELPIYFCHPSCPWERGSNENANRQLRYWFRKGTDIGVYSQSDIDRVTFILNNQPRRLLGWSTSARRYGELAVLSGRPRAARAVGSEMRNNPIPFVIPCHRVVAAGNRIGGYGGGRNAVALKRKLLEREGVSTLR